MDASLKKVFNKTLVDISATVADDLYKKFENVEEFSSEVKQTIKDIVDAYKAEIKEGVKTDNKKQKKTAAKGTRKATKYNRYMKQQMAELKESHPELSNNEKFAMIAAKWKLDKNTWEDTEETDGNNTV
jgi:hypothetical protein